MYPARWFFNKHEEPTTEVAIRRMSAKTSISSCRAYQVRDQSASMEIVVNPLVNWIWLGFAVMAFGTGIVLLPERTFAFAMAKFPAEAATTATMLLLMVPRGSRVRAAHETESVPSLVRRIRSRSGCIRRSSACAAAAGRSTTAACPTAAATCAVGENPALMAAGKGPRRRIIATFVRDFGSQDILHRPIDKGFNRLAWAVSLCVRRTRRRRRRFRREEVVARVERRAAPSAAGIRPRTRRCRRGSTASSKTSTSPLSPTQSTSDSLRPWQFFTLGALVCATAAVFIIRGTSAENLIFVCLGIFAAALVGLASLSALRPLVDGRDATAGNDRQPHARGTRARKESGAAVHQGAGVRPRDGEGRRRPTIDEMVGRLRSRAVRLLEQLDNTGSGYREMIERELAKRLVKAGRDSSTGAETARRQSVQGRIEPEHATRVARACATCATVERRRREVLQIVRHEAARVVARALYSFFLLLLPFFALRSAQFQMPDPKQMSGIPRPVTDLPAGHVSVRLIRGQLRITSRAIRSRCTAAARSSPSRPTRTAARSSAASPPARRSRPWRPWTANVSSRRSFRGRATAASA